MITTLSQLIALVESNNHSNAVRYEELYSPDYRAHALVRVYQSGLSDSTYRILLASSWGKYQIMGDQLYLLGLKTDIRTFWSDEAAQDDFFNRFIFARNIAYTLDQVINDEECRTNFAHHYNGNAIVYGARMLQVYEVNKGV